MLEESKAGAILEQEMQGLGIREKPSSILPKCME